MYRGFFEGVGSEDLRLRFFAPVKEFSHAFIARLTQIDYARAFAIAAIREDNGLMLGCVRLMSTPIPRSANTPSCCAPTSRGRGSAGS